jgi:hypothetical protein
MFNYIMNGCFIDRNLAQGCAVGLMVGDQNRGTMQGVIGRHDGHNLGRLPLQAAKGVGGYLPGVLVSGVRHDNTDNPPGYGAGRALV